jgi:RNA polymerase sigma factor (TIGR02999 family)
MSEESRRDTFTQLLLVYSKGDRSVLNQMLPMVYEELRRLASSHLKRERKNHTLQTTALVHEAYMRLVDQREVDWKNSAQFLGVASEVMRRILVNYARDRAASKRGGGMHKVSLRFADESPQEGFLDVIVIDDALNELALHDERKGRVVELKIFGGLTTDEIAEVLQISSATVKREWTLARAWLYRALSRSKERVHEAGKSSESQKNGPNFH